MRPGARDVRVREFIGVNQRIHFSVVCCCNKVIRRFLPRLVPRLHEVGRPVRVRNVILAGSPEIRVRRGSYFHVVHVVLRCFVGRFLVLF